MSSLFILLSLKGKSMSEVVSSARIQRNEEQEMQDKQKETVSSKV